MRAKTVRDVVLGEAKAGDIDDMEHIASVISNRARELGISEQDVVASGDFDAYGKSLPSGVTKFAKQAEAAIEKVAKDGPVTNATYYATPDRVSNLGRKVTKTGMVAKTKGHQYYAAPLKAGVPLGQIQVAQAPSGGLAAFFSDPLGLQAQAAEAPAGLAAFAAPEKSPQQAQIDYFGSVPTTDWSQQREEAIAQRTATPALSDPSFNSRFAANQPALSAPSFDARFGAPAAPDASRFAPGLQAALGPVSPEQYAEAKQPASAKARAAFDAIAAGLGAPGVSTQPEGLGSLAGSMVGPAPDEAPMTTDAKGTYATPFGPSQFGVAAQASEMPAEASAFTEQPHSVTTQAMRDSVATQPGAVAPGLGAPQDVKDYNVAGLQPGLLSPSMMAPGLQASSALGLMPENTNTLQPFDQPSQFSTEPTIDDPNSFPAAPGSVGIEGQTIAGDFPAAPEDSMFGPVSKAALTGLLTGGPIGGLLGAASGMIGGGLGSLGGPAGVAQDHETFAAGSGLQGMNAGMYGERGATGRSLSQPGVFATSRGPNQGYDLNNQFGARTTYGPSGDIRANSGTMDAWGRVLGGLFDRPDKSKKGQSGRGLGGLSQAGRDAVGKGRGGLY